MKKLAVELQPVRDVPGYFERIEAKLLKFFRDEIYIPLLKEFPEKTKIIKNSQQDLIDAIKSGRITYYRGQFKGRFSSTLSRELRSFGAEWDRTQGSWKIPQSKMPMELRHAIAVSEETFSQTLGRIDRRLSEIVPEDIVEKLKISGLFDQTLWRVESDLQKSAKNLIVMPELSVEARAKIAEDYTENMKLYVSDFTRKEIKSLREDVEANAYAGIRYEHLAKDIEKSYGVSQNKAKFLARQETSIMMSKFKEVRYLDAGISHYRWKCAAGSPNHPVRPWHKMHDGKVFSFDNPPQTDAHGNHKNPGMDYNCRCVSIPILKKSVQ